MNSAALVAPTHIGPVRVSDGTITQVVVWMINKWRAKIIQRELYNVRDPPWRKGEGGERNIVVIRTVLVINFKNYIQELISSNCAKNDFH